MDIKRPIEPDKNSKDYLGQFGDIAYEQDYAKYQNDLEQFYKKIIDTFITHSNGLSIWVRLSHYKDRLPKDLADDIQDLYNYQCFVEDELGKFK